MVGPRRPENQPDSVMFRWEMNSARTAVIVYTIAVSFPLVLCAFFYFSTGRFLWGATLISFLFVRSVIDSVRDFAKYRRLAIEAEAEEGSRKENLKIKIANRIINGDNK